jgi:hypothetical protein
MMILLKRISLRLKTLKLTEELYLLSLRFPSNS